MPAFDPALFDAIAPRLIADLVALDGLSEEEAAKATADYHHFLNLVNDETPTCPPSLADKAWHRHMDQSGYDTEIVAMCGRMLNHDKEAFGTPEFAAAWADTRARWASAFDENLDPDHENLDGCKNSPAVCVEQPKADARLTPAVCVEQPKADARFTPAVCVEQPKADARFTPAVCVEQPKVTTQH